MNEIIKTDTIENKIYEIRGTQVMLDSDLAELYECTNGTKSINLAVKRNINKFPNDIYFQLNENEFNNLKFHFETSSLIEHGGVRKLPHVFTEEGVAMLATVLHTKIADEISLKIIRAFVSMRRYISNNIIENKFYKNMLLEHDSRLLLVEQSLDKLNEKQKINTIFFEGQIYDAYSLLMDILNNAKEEIIIIDNYAGRELLDILKDINKKIKIVSNKTDEILIKKYNNQYENIEFIQNNSFHDRFIIIDKKELYNSGASFKDLGTKCFALNKVENPNYIDTIVNSIL